MRENDYNAVQQFTNVSYLALLQIWHIWIS